MSRTLRRPRNGASNSVSCCGTTPNCTRSCSRNARFHSSERRCSTTTRSLRAATKRTTIKCLQTRSSSIGSVTARSRITFCFDHMQTCSSCVSLGFALELVSRGAGSVFCTIHRFNGLCPAILSVASDRLCAASRLQKRRRAASDVLPDAQLCDGGEASRLCDQPPALHSHAVLRK
jgi:hypothetical protein